MITGLNNKKLKERGRIDFVSLKGNCIKKYTESYISFLVLYGVILAIALSKYYKSGNIIFGGEGNYFLDFYVHFNTYAYVWFEIGTGFFGTSVNAEFFNVYFLIFLQNLFGSIAATNFILIYLIYFLPFLGIFLLCKELKISPPLSFGIALFYIVNPFSLNHLYSLNQWNTATLFVIPIFFWIILRYFNNNFKLFFYFGIVSFTFAFANANPPLVILHQISIIISMVIISYYLEPNISWVKIIKKYFIVLASFIVFNVWWIVNWFFIFADAKKIYTPGFAISWLNGAGINPILWKILTFTADIQPDPSYNFFSYHYNSTLAILLMLIPVLIIFFCIFITKHPKKYILYLAILLLVTGFLINGVRYPLGGVYGYLVLNNVIFSLFKTPTEKWGMLYIFLFTLLLIFTLSQAIKEKYYKYIISLFVVYLAFFSIPFITSNFIPDINLQSMGYGSRSYIDRVEYQNLREQINNDNLEYRVLSLPASGNYQVALPISGDKYYTGMDPVVSNLNKPFIATYSNNILVNYDILFDNISSPNYNKFLAIYNIKKIVIESDMVPWFGFRQKENISELERIFNTTMTYEKDGSLTIYDNGNNFLPRIYSTDTPIFINGSENEMFKVVTSNNFRMNNTALFVSSQVNETPENFLEKYKIHGNSKPAVTFQKINPTKYIVRIENATSPFFLVFSESYHPRWTAYFESESPMFNEVIAEYKDINVKETKHENSFVIGDISYLFKKSVISQDRHLLVNVYANGWYFDKPGTYYVTLYYWPQLLFYAGFLFSLVVLAVCSGILLFNRIRKNT